MLAIRNVSIKWKLTLIIVLTSSVTLLLGALFFAINDIQTLRQSMRRDLSILAQVIGANTTAALTFGDEVSAEETLAALAAEQHVVEAAVYGGDGQLFVAYQRDGAPETPVRPGDDGAFFRGGYLVLFQPITLDDQRIGTIFIQSDMGAVQQRIRRSIGIVALVMLAGLLVALMLASRLQGLISAPILSLAQTARDVSEQENYALRARKQGEDEIGVLIDRFNEMLSQIEQRDAALQEINQQLAVSEREALAASEAKGQFLANMSHELRTPMNAIIGYSEMLMEECEDLGQEAQIPDLQRINTAGKHLLALINDILDLSKIEAGKMELYLETFEVAPVVDDVVTTIGPLVSKNGNQLEVRLAEHLGSMHADMTKVRQALFNLLSNACKFTEQGSITLTVDRQQEPEGDWLRFEVRDSGIGMTEEQMGRLFEEFSQAHEATSRQYGGTGLGLAITQRFCEMMGGEVAAESKYGEGSTFTIRLPAEIIESQEPAAGETPTDAELTAGEVSASDGRDTVLVIDDDAAMRDLMRRFLAKEGFSVRVASSGEEGLRLARELHPAVITLDVMMPGMDGWAVLTTLKADAELADIPVIMLTIVDDADLGFSLGAAEFMTKPIERERLISILNKYLAKRQGDAVLVVEDEEPVRELLRRTLERHGWKAIEAENGRVALERVAESIPALILLDLMMPEMDGFEFVHELRKQPRWAKIPIVVITAKDLTDEDRRRLKGGVERIIEKGAYTREELLHEVRNVVASCVDEKKVAGA